MFAVKSGFSDIIGIFVVSDLFPILLFPGPENDPATSCQHQLSLMKSDFSASELQPRLK